MVPQNVPGDRVGFTAGQTGHDGFQITGDDAGLAVIGQRALIQAVSRLGLHHHELGRIVGEQVCEVAHHSTGQRADAGLDEHVGGTVYAALTKLVGGLVGHGAVALHDPGGDLLVAVPGGILHDDAVFRLCGFRGSHTHTVIVVDFLDGDLGALLGDIVKAGLAAALGHVYHRLLAQLVGRPCHAAAMVAIGGGEESGLTEFLTEGFAGQVVVIHFGHVPAHLAGDVPGHGEGAAQHLEGVETKPVGLILHIHTRQPQILGHTVQLRQRGDGVLGEGPVEGAGLGHVGQGHHIQMLIVTLRHMIEDPFELIFHGILASKIFLLHGKIYLAF